jgi:GNAT superfamily N-acetyltransferase
MALETILSEQEEKAFRAFVKDQIKAFNDAISPHHRQARAPGATVPLNLILKDDAGNAVGGLTASTYWEWLDVDDLYVPEAHRGKGLGTSLLQTAERIAVERGCKRCILSTFAFQARAFYEKQGYSVVGTLEDYPPGSAYYWMRKELVEGEG